MRKFLLLFFLLPASFSLLAQVPEFKLNRTFGTPLINPKDIALDQQNFMYVLDGYFVKKMDPAGRLMKSFNLSANFNGREASVLALDAQGNFYVVKRDLDLIQKFNPQGELILKFGSSGLGPGQFSGLQDLDVDDAGNIYAIDRSNDRIQKFDAQGGFVAEYRFADGVVNNGKDLVAIEVGKSGTIYLLTATYAIRKLSSSGQLIADFGISLPPSQSGADLKGGQNYLTLDAAENIYVSNWSTSARIHKLSATGQYLNSFGGGIFDQPIMGITSSESGEVHAVTYFASPKIFVFNAAGSLKNKFGAIHRYQAITQDLQDRYYTLEGATISKYNSFGQLLFQFGTPGKEEGKIWGAVAIQVDGIGNIYCLETDGQNWARIQKFSSDGNLLDSFEDFGSNVGFYNFTDLAIDIHGNFYVTDFIGGCVRKIDPTGRFLGRMIPKGTGKGQLYCPKALAVDLKGNVYVADYNGNRVQKFDPEGHLLVEANSATTPGDFVTTSPASLAVDLYGNMYTWNGASGFIRIYNETGKEIGQVTEAFGKLSIHRNGKKLLLARDALIWELLTGDPPQESLITGKIYQDSNLNCDPDENEKPLAGILVKAEPGPYYGISDEKGHYSIPVDTGTYRISAILPQDPGRTIALSCPANLPHQVKIPSQGSYIDGPDFGLQVSTAPVLNVAVASDRRRRCFRNLTTVSYGNSGFAMARNAKVTVQLPEQVSFIAANLPHTQDGKGNYIFAVGDLQPSQQGTITITDSVSCADPSIRNLTVCTKAWITPVNTYPAPAAWNRSDISVTGTTLADGQARFVIRNQGAGDMTDSLQFRVYQDTGLALVNNYKLASLDNLVLRFRPSGQAVRVEVDQPQGHPLKATAGANVEKKARMASAMPATLMIAYPPDDPEPEIAVECQPILDSFDPNDKQVVPTGITEEHYTPTNAFLRYTIRFQNTGTDYAYRVEVVDTLSADLDLSTLQVGAVSHGYRLAVTGKHQPVLTFTFDNIMLPDSTRDQVGSNGFVQFSLKPKAKLPEKTKIENYADIFFDYNEPVRTNTTVNRIYDMPRVIEPGNQLSLRQVIISPAVTDFMPGQSRPGQMVSLKGRNFAPTLAGNQVFFNGVKAPVLSASDSVLTVLVPVNAFSGKVKVVTPEGGAQSSTDYIIFQPPTFTTASTYEAVPGTVITLTGTHFSPLATQDTVTFNGVAAKILEASETNLKVEVPEGAGLGTIQVKTLGGQAESAQPFMIWYPPAITGLSPGKGKAGASVILTGHHFAENAARNQVKFGDIPAEVKEASAGRLLVIVPPQAQTGKIRLQTPGGPALTSTDFTFIQAPEIYSFTPGQGNAGAIVTLAGLHFNADGQADTVYFNDLPAKVLNATETQLQVQAPKGVESGSITVAGAGGRAVTTGFQVPRLAPVEAITVYPNPTKAGITVNWFKANFTVERLEVYNAIGKLVAEKDLKEVVNEEQGLMLTSFGSGVYTLRIHTSAGPVVKQVVVL